MYAIVPQPSRPRRSPFDVPGLNKGITKQEILEVIRESRERDNLSMQPIADKAGSG